MDNVLDSVSPLSIIHELSVSRAGNPIQQIMPVYTTLVPMDVLISPFYLPQEVSSSFKKEFNLTTLFCLLSKRMIEDRGWEVIVCLLGDWPYLIINARTRKRINTSWCSVRNRFNLKWIFREFFFATIKNRGLRVAPNNICKTKPSPQRFCFFKEIRR